MASNIREVAERAGVATCTVSRVLNGTANVSDKTRSKVEQAMKELNYTPNELARRMFQQRSGIIGMLVPSIQHPFFSSLARYMESRLVEKGYKLLLMSTVGEDHKETGYSQILKSNLVDGVIMAVNLEQSDEYLQSLGKPVVQLDPREGTTLPYVVADHLEGGRLAAEALAKSGCKHVIHLVDKDEKGVLSYASHRSFMEYLYYQNVRTVPIGIDWDHLEVERYVTMATKLLKENPEIDGIMAPDLLAMAFYKAALRLGRKIPENFAVVAYDGTYVISTSPTDLTTVQQPIEELAKSTVRMMMDLLHGHGSKAGTWQLQLPVNISYGQSTTRGRM